MSFENLEVGRKYEIDRNALPPHAAGDLRNLSDVIRESPRIAYIKMTEKLTNVGPRNVTAFKFELQDAQGNVIYNEDVGRILGYKFYAKDSTRIPFTSAVIYDNPQQQGGRRRKTYKRKSKKSKKTRKH